MVWTPGSTSCLYLMRKKGRQKGLNTWKPALRQMSTALSTMLFRGTTLVPRTPPDAVTITFALRHSPDAASACLATSHQVSMHGPAHSPPAYKSRHGCPGKPQIYIIDAHVITCALTFNRC